MYLIVNNTSSDSFSYLSGRVVIAARGDTDVPQAEWYNLIFEQDFWVNVKNNNFIISDGVTRYRFPESETYIKSLISSNMPARDTDGAQIVRTKAAKKGWSFWAVPIEITTSTLGGSLFIQDSTGTNIPWITCKIYDDNNAEITTAGLAGINLTTCVKTVIDFEPTFDFEIIGGSLCINSNPTQDIRLWIVGAPDIPAVAGGSKEFASGINLKFLSADSPLQIDGRVTKFLQYNPATHQGKMRIILKHPAGTQVNMQLTIQIYRL